MFLKSQGHVTTDGQSVSMSRCWARSRNCDQILLSLWRLLSEICHLVFLTRGWVCHLSVSVYRNLSVCTLRIYVSCAWQFSNVYAIHTNFYQSWLGTADYALLVTSNSHYKDIDTWTVIQMTSAKFKPLIF
jgi:hypothetical protein